MQKGADQDSVRVDLARAREREQATRDILEVISQSRDDEWPVFDVILRSAARLCHAPLADLDIVDPDGVHLREVATFGGAERVIPSDRWVWPMDGPYYHVEAVRSGKVMHVHDLRDTENYRAGNPMTVAAVDTENMRTMLAVPLRSGTKGIGCLVLFRQEVHPFSEDEIALVETFAAQAVIAVENVRQFRELQERLDRETATGQVLQVISSSRDDDLPVFETILENAARLCGAVRARLLLTNSEKTQLHAIGSWGELNPAMPDGIVIDMIPEMLPVRCIMEKTTINVADGRETEGYKKGIPQIVSNIDTLQARSVLVVPLIRDGEAIGCIVLTDRTVAAYDDNDVSLIETFAAQAVIAIENVRQFRELRTRLEREAATRKILQVISSSRDNEQPIFDIILELAARLCRVSSGSLLILDDERTRFHMASFRGPQLTPLEPNLTWNLNDPLPVAEALREARSVHIPDLEQSAAYRDRHPVYVRLFEKENVRVRLVVPLLRNGVAIGAIVLNRIEPSPFADDEIELIEIFAAQAVIAIENVRQFREVHTRLEREKALREILAVISQSRHDERPVFEVVLRKSAALCGASLASLNLVSEDGNRVVKTASWGDQASDQLAAGSTDWPIEAENAPALCVREGKLVHLDDMAATDLYRSGDERRVAAVDSLGIRTFLAVPLFNDRRAVGCISVYRQEVKPFAPDEIALLETFAAQAVIAIENVRQFHEVQERLERERASREILQVISGSRDDELPVFDTILENACRLCDAPLAFLSLVNDQGTHFRVPAHRGAGPEMAKVWDTQLEPLEGSALTTSRAIKDRRIIQINDLSALDKPDTIDGRRAQLVKLERIRTYLVIPLIRDKHAIGTINLYRREVRPFTPEQIELVETFAAQAVIAIENVRQFRALEERTAEVESLNTSLESRVSQQVGEIERMGRLKRFLPSAVADAVVLSGNDKMLSSHRALVSVLFCDIRGFTAFCETAEPEETIEVLQTYHQEMGKLIAEHGASIDHRMGDGIMVLFNDPLPCEDPTGDAVRLAIAMRARMSVLCKKWKRMGYRLGFGVGVSLGYATVGMVGFEGRLDYTASGTAINLASRLCDEAKDGDILLSPKASIAVEDNFQVESCGEVSLKGLREPLEVFRLTGGPET